MALVGIHFSPKNLAEVQFYPRYSELCPNCKRVIFERKDYIHGHYFCEKCGYLTKEILVNTRNGMMEEYAVGNDGKYNVKYFMKSEKADIKKLRNIYETYTNNNTQQYRIDRDYKHFTDIVASTFQMTKYQRDDVLWYIKRAEGVNTFCKTCPYENIILGLAIMVMRNDGRKIRLKGQYKIINEIGLTEKQYSKILENVIQFVR